MRRVGRIPGRSPCKSALADPDLHGSASAAEHAPYARRVIVVAPACACCGAAAHFLGTLAATMQRWDEAAGRFEEALVVNERLGAPPLIARTQLSYARMLLDRRGAGDRERATALLAPALESAETLGMPVVASDCRELLARAALAEA